MKLNDFSKHLQYIFFPKRCRYCGKLITADKELCDGCNKHLPTVEPPICLYCGQSKKDCNCHKAKNYYKSIAAPFYYESAIRTMIDRMKFKENKFLCAYMADDMYKVFVREYGDITFDTICYIPFSEKDKRKRSFNHAKVIASILSEKTGIGISDAVCRIYDTKSQHSLNSHDRKGNVFGAYDVKDTFDAEDKTVLLIDDVKTTGATLNECAKILKIHGAKEVYALTFAATKGSYKY